LLEHDVEANGFISKTQNRTALRGVVDEDTKERYYDRANNTLDSIPVVDLKSDGIKKGDLYAGDFNKLFYGIPYNLSYKISEEGQLSTVTNADGSPVNLFEQELIALRVTMDVAFHVAQDEAFAKLEAGSGETV
ncbi:phage major capsid family protein, partial [Staphylococcus saprophyticus]